jgi:hypothetical protein
MKHQLLLLLTENKDYSTSELAERLGVSRRQIYNDFENLKRLGFQLVKTGTKYRLDRKSPFFKRLHENIALTEPEAAYVYRLLDSVPHPQHPVEARTLFQPRHEDPRWATQTSRAQCCPLARGHREA